MKITDEMLNLAKNSRSTKNFTIIDENFIMIVDNVRHLIPVCEKLRNNGVNYAGPVDYRIVDGKCYTLQHRAKGIENDISRITFRNNDNSDYLNCFLRYLNIIESFSAIPLEHFLKFFSDIEMMREENIKPDVCSLDNLFYDKDVGFSFIDVYPGDDRLSISSIFLILLNRKFSINGVSVIPLEYKDRYDKAMKSIFEKIIIGLKRYGYPEEELQEFLQRKIFDFGIESCVSQDEYHDYIVDTVANRDKGVIYISI